uniref:Uncharacterized protein n=1 Tax=Heterorhabditis bacteriophora TaxID=37862 RepID=A0A1I7W615_HETBA
MLRDEWETERLNEEIDLTEDIDPAPFQLVKNTSLFKVINNIIRLLINNNFSIIKYVTFFISLYTIIFIVAMKSYKPQLRISEWNTRFVRVLIRFTVFSFSFSFLNDIFQIILNYNYPLFLVSMFWLILSFVFSVLTKVLLKNPNHHPVQFRPVSLMYRILYRDSSSAVFYRSSFGKADSLPSISSGRLICKIDHLFCFSKHIFFQFSKSVTSTNILEQDVLKVIFRSNSKISPYHLLFMELSCPNCETTNLGFLMIALLFISQLIPYLRSIDLCVRENKVGHTHTHTISTRNVNISENNRHYFFPSEKLSFFYFFTNFYKCITRNVLYLGFNFCETATSKLKNYQIKVFTIKPNSSFPFTFNLSCVGPNIVLHLFSNVFSNLGNYIRYSYINRIYVGGTFVSSSKLIGLTIFLKRIIVYKYFFIHFDAVLDDVGLLLLHSADIVEQIRENLPYLNFRGVNLCGGPQSPFEILLIIISR